MQPQGEHGSFQGQAPPDILQVCVSEGRRDREGGWRGEERGGERCREKMRTKERRGEEGTKGERRGEEGVGDTYGGAKAARWVMNSKLKQEGCTSTELRKSCCVVASPSLLKTYSQIH